MIAEIKSKSLTTVFDWENTLVLLLQSMINRGIFSGDFKCSDLNALAVVLVSTGYQRKYSSPSFLSAR